MHVYFASRKLIVKKKKKTTTETSDDMTEEARQPESCPQDQHEGKRESAPTGDL